MMDIGSEPTEFRKELFISLSKGKKITIISIVCVFILGIGIFFAATQSNARNPQNALPPQPTGGLQLFGGNASNQQAVEGDSTTNTQYGPQTQTSSPSPSIPDSATPTASPSATETPVPTSTPTATPNPTATPTPKPTDTPTPTPTQTPTPTITPTPTASPTPTPTP